MSPANMPSPRARMRRAVVGLLVGYMTCAGVVGCSDHEADGPHAHRPAEPFTVVPGAVDVGFSQDMSAHHAQAVEMARIAQENADPVVAGLARSMYASQLEEIGRLQGFLSLWGAEVVTQGESMRWMRGAHHHGGQPTGRMPGMASTVQLEALRRSSGKKQRRLFLELMLRHHRGGVSMAEFAARKAAVPQVRALAARMAYDQQQESMWMAQLARG